MKERVFSPDMSMPLRVAGTLAAASGVEVEVEGVAGARSSRGRRGVAVVKGRRAVRLRRRREKCMVSEVRTELVVVLGRCEMRMRMRKR